MTLTRTDFVPLAPVQLVKPNGRVKGYGLGAATGGQRAAALESAVAALAAGDRLTLGPGDFTLSAPLAIGVQCAILGSGYGTHLSFAGDWCDITADRVSIENLRASGRCDVVGAEEVSISDCWLDGGAQISVVSLTALAHYASLSNNVITGGDNGVFIKQSNGTRIVGNKIRGATFNGIDCEYDATANVATRGVGASGSDVTKWRPPLITANHIEQCGQFGVFLHRAHDAVITGNNFERNADAGIYVWGPIQTVIAGNQFERNGGVVGTSTLAQIIIDLIDLDGEAPDADCIVSGNEFGAYQQGVIIRGTAAEAYAVKISGNMFLASEEHATHIPRAIWATGYNPLYTLHISNNTIFGRESGTTANKRGIEVGEDEVAVVDGSRIVVQGNYASHVDRGLTVWELDGVKVLDNCFRLNNYGVRNFSSTNTLIVGNILEDNVTADFSNAGTAPTYSAKGNVGLADNGAHSTKNVSLLVTDPADDLTAGDGQAFYRVPAALNGYNLVGVAAAVTTASSSGLPTIQIHNVASAADMLSTALTIDATETDSSTAATPAVIDTAQDDVATAEQLRIDVDVAGTGAKGLMVELTFQLP